MHVGEVGTVEELRTQLAKHPWDLVLLEIAIAGTGGAEVLSLLVSSYPSTRLLIVSALPETEHAIAMFKAGAHGYYPKQHPLEDLVNAVKAILAGGSYYSDEARRWLAGVHTGTVAYHDALSARELTVLRSLAQGKSVKQIAHELSVSEKTVATYVGRIRQKTGLQNYADMTRFALRNHLID